MKQLRPLNILIIEYDSEVRDVLAMCLTELGMSPICLSKATEGIEYLKKNKNKIDSVFVDLNLPEFDGLEFIEYIKNVMPEYEQLNFTLMMAEIDEKTSHFDKDNLYLQSIQYLIKPFNIYDIRKVIESVSKNSAKKVFNKVKQES